MSDGITPTAGHLDPAARAPADGQALPLTNDGLVAFRRVGGSTRRARWWPDLAVVGTRRRPTAAAPTPSSCAAGCATRTAYGGARLRHPPRPRARPARRPGHRVVLHVDPSAPERCLGQHDVAATCPRGIVQADDSAGTITFHLTAPRSALPVRAGAAHSPSPLPPGTGPLGSRAGRCPRPVRTWSPGSRARADCGWCATRTSASGRAPPARRIPRCDHCIDCCADAAAAVRAVEQGRADLVGGIVGPAVGAAPAQSSTRSSTRFAGPAPQPRRSRGTIFYWHEHARRLRSTTSTCGVPSTTPSIATRSLAGRRAASALAQADVPDHAARTSPATDRIARIRPTPVTWPAVERSRSRLRPAPHRPITHPRHARDGAGDGSALTFIAPEHRILTLLKRLGYRVTLHGSSRRRRITTAYVADPRRQAQIGAAIWLAGLRRRLGASIGINFSCDALASGLITSRPELLGVLRPPHTTTSSAAQRLRGHRQATPPTRSGPRSTDEVVDKAAALPLLNTKTIELHLAPRPATPSTTSSGASCSISYGCTERRAQPADHV